MINLMIVITLLILINFLVTLARLQKRKWLRITLFIIAGLLLLPSFLFGLKAII
ncbi:hypothetical protein SAMN05444392_101459 [Seinonella peptonophila]|uniref:Uncharacterized protein n=1 Tax=Seinonella peptonophila TaxID=112248 RepID=A0A1M4TGU6_9BACL|nr:hypothetical protein [Seinonella peptonophila]SHE43638.1 hypothetical protein SAMN05444392_101459 [Seinonella peptonophila]